MALEAPITYWDNLSSIYEEKGKSWRTWALVSGGCLIVLILATLYNLPDALKAPDFFTFETMKGTIIYALLISVGVYFVRFFVRLSISAYHLSRDAIERSKLTYVYLALLKEEAVSKEDRQIVLQSLFSRADTGLLKGDSSPDMPQGLVGNILNNMK